MLLLLSLPPFIAFFSPRAMVLEILPWARLIHIYPPPTEQSVLPSQRFKDPEPHPQIWRPAPFTFFTKAPTQVSVQCTNTSWALGLLTAFSEQGDVTRLTNLRIHTPQASHAMPNPKILGSDSTPPLVPSWAVGAHQLAPYNVEWKRFPLPWEHGEPPGLKIPPRRDTAPSHTSRPSGTQEG